MAENFDRAWETDKIVLNEQVGFAAGDYDPIVTGHAGPEGSRYYRTTGDVYVKTGAGDTDWLLIAKPSRNYADLEYYLIHNLFHTMAEAHVENIYNVDLTNNMYVDSFGNMDWIFSLNGTVLTGDSCILSLNRNYTSTLAGDGFEDINTLIQCYFDDCSIDTWTDNNFHIAPTVGVDGFDPYSGTYVCRLARKANVEDYVDYWTCLLSDDVANIDITTDTIKVRILIKSGAFPADVAEMPLSIHLHSTGQNFLDYYTSSVSLTSDTAGAWVEYEFNVVNCEFLDTITHMGVAVGHRVNSAYDFEMFVDGIEFVNGTVRNTHGSFVREPLVTDYDITDVLIDRKTYAPYHVGRITNHLSLDGGAHYKMHIPIGVFASAESGGELEAPDAERFDDQLLTQDGSISFRYHLPAGADDTHDLEIYPGTESTQVLSKSGHVDYNNFSTDTTADYTEYGTGTVTYQASTQDLDIAHGGQNKQHLFVRIPTHADHTKEQYIHADVAISRVNNAYDLGGLLVRAGTTAGDKGYFAAIYTDGSNNTRFVLGRDSTIQATGTYTGILADTRYVIEIAVQDGTGTTAKISARFWNDGQSTLYDSLTWEDPTRIDSGNLGMVAGSFGGHNGGDVIVTYDDLGEHFGWGEYRYFAGTPDYVDFLPGREPTGTLRAHYFLPFVGAWDHKQSAIIIATFEKEIRYIEVDTTPEIDDFLLMAKVSES